MSAPLRICFAASEMTPYAKTGGLADVAGALPPALHRLGHDVRPFLPLYGSIDAQTYPTQPVEFAQDIELHFGWRRYVFSLRTARLADSGMQVYFIDCPELFHRDSLYTDSADEALRFGLFNRAVLESCQRMGFAPELIHCNDWHTALIPILLRTHYAWDALFRETRTVLTIHNLGYQGQFPASALEELDLHHWSHLFDHHDLQSGRLNFLRSGLLYTNWVTTVSPTYAREICTAEYGMGLEDLLQARRATLRGILNGVDYDEWSPERDRYIPHPYSVTRLEGKVKNKKHLLTELGLADDTGPPLLGIVSRLVAQKGFELAADVLPRALAQTSLRLAVLGSGEARFEKLFHQIQQRFPGRAVYYRGYQNELAHLIEAGADMFLMPSRYEPCGLNQMFSLRYGTIPIVRRTGGLADSVELFDESTGRGNGFVFDHYNAEALAWALRYALTVYPDKTNWHRVVRNAMASDFSWERQSKRYVELYQEIAQRPPA